MRVTFYNSSKTVIATKEEPLAYKELLYHAFSEQSELLLNGAYYRVRGLRVGLPVENPPDISVTLDYLRKAPTYDDYC